MNWWKAISFIVGTSVFIATASWLLDKYFASKSAGEGTHGCIDCRDNQDDDCDCSCHHPHDLPLPSDGRNEMSCPHLLLIWEHKAEGDWQEDEMRCSACGQLMKFERVYQEETGRP